jgi:5-methyltetrahydropteroyltriglutamate--homocysteine methyltransferase
MTTSADVAAEKLTSSRKPRVPARAEQIGSLLRPQRLKDAIEAFYEPGHSAMLDEERAKDVSELRAVEDELIRDAVRKQLDIGLDVVSDGEFRRYMFTSSFYDCVSGLAPGTGQVPFTGEDGTVVYYTGVPVVKDRLAQIDNPARRESAFLHGLTDHPFKVTFPAASMFWYPHAYVAGITDAAYPSQQEMVDDVIEILQDQVAQAVEAGAPYVQFDWTIYPMLADPASVAFLEEQGIDPDEFLDRLIDADRRVIENVPAGVRTGLHLCRGNHKSRWIFTGPLDPYAERLFNDLPYDAFLIEWEDTERTGDFSALRYVPKGPTVVLGIMSSKKPRIETVDELVRGVDAAANLLDVGQLALSPQCGFASTYHGNEVTEDVQWRKLEVLVEAAAKIWPY